MTDREARLSSGLGEPGPEPALVRCGELLREVLDRPGFAFSDADVRENLREAYALAAVVDAVKLLLVQELRSRPGVVPGAPGDRAAERYLTEALRVSSRQAGRDVDAAAAVRSTAPELPLMGAALAEGQVSREHLDVAVSTLRRVPQKLKRKAVPDGAGGVRTGAQVIDAEITEFALRVAPPTVENLGRQLVHRLDPDRADRFDPEAFERRTCSMSSDFAGMGILRLYTDPASTLELRSIIARYSAPRPTGAATGEDGAGQAVRDERTLGQRQADAVVDLIRAGAAAAQALDPGGTPTEDPSDPADPSWALERPSTGAELTIVATLDQFTAAFTAANGDDGAAAAAGLARMSLAGPLGTRVGATIEAPVLARWACDSPIRRILLDEKGAVLHHGRSRRLASAAQKRSLVVRDVGCCIPGCDIPAEWCEVHHVIPWEHGGATDIDAMALLCRRHHTAHHAGVYAIQMRDGVPWVRVPAWVDPARPWLRNATHDRHRVADRVARTLTGAPALPGLDGEPEQAGVPERARPSTAPTDPDDPWIGGRRDSAA